MFVFLTVLGKRQCSGNRPVFCTGRFSPCSAGYARFSTASVIVEDRAETLGVAQNSTTDSAQVEKEGFVGFHRGVSQHGDRDRLAILARRKSQHATGRGVVGTRHGGAVGRGVIHHHIGHARVRHSDREDEGSGAGIAFGLGDVADGDRRRIVVEDFALTLAVGNDHAFAAGSAQIDEEGFVKLVDSISQHVDRYRLAGFEGHEGQRAAGGGVVAARHRILIGRGIVHRYRLKARWLQADRERERIATRIALGFGYIVDFQGIGIKNFGLYLRDDRIARGVGNRRVKGIEAVTPSSGIQARLIGRTSDRAERRSTQRKIDAVNANIVRGVDLQGDGAG